MIEDREKFAELNKELGLKLDAANVYKDVLIGKLRKHDLAKLSMTKPGLVEKKINNGTAKLFRSLETISGAVAPAPAKQLHQLQRDIAGRDQDGRGRAKDSNPEPPAPCKAVGPAFLRGDRGHVPGV